MVTAASLVYRLLYGGLLSRLPEATAVRVGQTLLRALPVDRLPLFTVQDPRLETTLGGVRLPNPLVLAAMYYDPAILSRAMGLGFGAVTTKSITRQPRPGHPPPNLVRVHTAAGPGLVNCNRAIAHVRRPNDRSSDGSTIPGRNTGQPGPPRHALPSMARAERVRG